MAEEAAAGFEYLDHTADVQIHSWGEDFSAALSHGIVGMMNYMTDVSKVKKERCVSVSVNGHDALSLVYNFFNEWLYQFNGEEMVFCEVCVDRIDLKSFRIEARGFGEVFDVSRHPQGTEIKAITYSAMQVHGVPGQESFVNGEYASEYEKPKFTGDGCHIFVVVDI